MKHYLLNLTCLFIIAALFTNCQKEDTINQEVIEALPTEQILPTVKTIYNNQVVSNTYTSLKSKYSLNTLLYNSIESYSKLSKASSTNKGIIIHDDIIKEITLGGYTSYTMRLTLSNANPASIYNLTVEDNNGKSGMFITKYTPTEKWLSNKEEPFEGEISTMRYSDFTTPYPDDAGGGGSYTSTTYPTNCNGFVVSTTVIIPYQCGCTPRHWPGESCDCYGQPGYNYQTTYECIADSNYSGSGSSSGGNIPGGSGTGSSGSGTPSFTVLIGIDGEIVKDFFANIPIDLTNTTKINPIEELKCFDLTKGAKLTVYVQQPRENSSDIMGPNSVGHAFIGIEQDGIVRQLGFYPESSANIALVAVGKNYDSELRSNNDYLYHVSISKDISSSQLNSITNYIKNFPSTYNVNNYACTDFAIKIGNLGGMNLPSTTVNNLTFSGRSPGQLGQEIRSMNSNSLITISKTKGNSPKSQGSCN